MLLFCVLVLLLRGSCGGLGGFGAWVFCVSVMCVGGFFVFLLLWWWFGLFL